MFGCYYEYCVQSRLVTNVSWLFQWFVLGDSFQVLSAEAEAIAREELI